MKIMMELFEDLSPLISIIALGISIWVAKSTQTAEKRMNKKQNLYNLYYNTFGNYLIKEVYESADQFVNCLTKERYNEFSNVLHIFKSRCSFLNEHENKLYNEITQCIQVIDECANNLMNEETIINKALIYSNLGTMTKKIITEKL